MGSGSLCYYRINQIPNALAYSKVKADFITRTAHVILVLIAHAQMPRIVTPRLSRRAAKALARLRAYADSPEHSLLGLMRYCHIPCTDPYHIF